MVAGFNVNSAPVDVTVTRTQQNRGELLNMAKVGKEAVTTRPIRERRSASNFLGSNSEIARKLGEYYGSLLSDEVPDRFTKLLDRLAESEQEKQIGADGKAER